MRTLPFLSSHSLCSDVKSENLYNVYNYDVLIGDITEKTLFTSLSDRFGVPYLSHADPTVEPEWPVKGIIFGPNKRVFVNLVLATEARRLNVFFLVNSTCPTTFVSPTVLAELIPGDDPSCGIEANIHGVLEDVDMSPASSHFADLNMLGNDFFMECEGKLLVDYPSQTCTLFRG